MLTVKEPIKDLGRLKYGVAHSFTYTVTNSAKDSSTITKLILGCNSCTKAHTNKTVLFPGESTDINVTFTPGSTGINTKQINIQYTTGGQQMKNVVLKFKAMVDG